MSGYFDALMRSSGLPMRDRAHPAAQVDPSRVDAGLTSSLVEAPPSAVEMAPAAPQRIGAPPAADLAEPSASPPRARERTVVQPEPTPSPHREVARPLPLAEAVHEPRASLAIQAKEPVQSKDVIRAAMQWVAEGESQGDGAAQAVTHRNPSQRTSEERVAVSAPRAGDERDIDALERPPSRPAPTVAVASDIPVRDPVNESAAAPVLARRSALPIQPLRQPPAVPLHRDEVVEVSIGAIHVRVDAPAAQVVAPPSGPPPTPAPRASAERPARSSLSRRALRRI